MSREEGAGTDGGSRAFWAEYYEGVFHDGPQWLDYSNERVHLQTFGAVIEASDHLVGRRVLDVGCGRGLFCRLAKVLGAASVTGIDQVESAMAELGQKNPDLAFRSGNIGDASFRASLGTFDNVYLIEVLQYLPAPSIFDWVWELLAPGGVLSAVFPNLDDPLVQKTIRRFDGKFAPPSIAAFGEWAKTKADLTTWAVRGFRFQEDQRIVPYELLPWTREPSWTDQPNRIQLVARKAPGAG